MIFRTITAFVVAFAMTQTMAAQAEDWGELRIGVEGAYPPFSEITTDGELRGFDIDIAHALCDELGADCTLVQQDWDGIIPALLSRRFDTIVASMGITEARARRVAFTDKYYESPARFAAPKGAEIELTREGLADKVIAVQRATVYDSYLTDEFGDDIDLRRYATQDEIYLDAQAGRIDLIMADQTAMKLGFLNTERGEDWELIGPEYRDSEHMGDGLIGIAVRPDDDELREALNEAILALRESGRYQEIQDKYFDFDIYGAPLDD